MGELVYEGVNETLREIVVGTTMDSLEGTREAHRRVLPPAIKHWDFAAHRIVYREVERNLPERDARIFLSGYARSIESGGWRVFLV